MFFGALAFATSASFVGCKDYDDDIDNLQGQIDKIASSLSDLQAKVGTYVKSVTYDPATGKLTVVNGENSVVYTIAQNLPNYTISVGKDGTVSLLKDGQVVSSGAITFPAGAAAFDPAKLTVDAATGKVMYDGVETKVTVPTDGVLSIEDKKNADGVTIGYTIRYKDQAVTFALNDVLTLKGLVFKSDLFVDGIEAIEYPYMDYNYLKSATSATTGWNDERGVACAVTTASTEWNYAADGTTQYNPIEYINYHLNPSSAKVSKEDLSFVSRDVQAISRASVAGPKVADMKPADEGVLPVGFTAIGKDIKGTGEASIMALQAVVKAGNDTAADTIVTSDYAMLYPSIVTPQAIAFNDVAVEAENCAVTANPDELFKTVENAIKNAPSLAVAYNKSLDLKELLTIHYNHVSGTKNNGSHKVWVYGDEAKYGLKYDFAFIQYKNGTNVTSDSKYVDQTAIANGVVTPRIVDADGSTLGEQGISSVGKRPLVRVRVTDSQNRVVLYAFIKIEIAKQVDDIVTTEFARNHNFGCDDADLKLTWSEISYQLLEKAAVQSKDEFDALYQFDIAAGEGTQYVKSNGKFVVATAAQKLGKVVEIPDATGTTNTVLHWTLETYDQETIHARAGHTATIYVRYISRLSTTAHAPIYMPLKATIAKPQGTVTAKLTNFWYNNLTNTRLNVNYPVDNGSTAIYKVNLNQVWETGKPKFNPTANFTSFTDAIFATQNGAITGAVGDGGYKYYFDAEQNDLTIKVNDVNVTYTLSVDNTLADCIQGGSYPVTPESMIAHAFKVDNGVFTNTKLYANGVQIATINQTTGEITYENNPTSKILLNAFGHKEAKHFAQIGICAYSPCGIAMSLTNNSYPAYFIRPIDAVGTTNGEFIDAQANGSTLDIAKLFNFQDWRDVKFVDGTTYTNCWLYAFYGLNNVKVDLAKVTTTLSGGTLGSTLLSSKTPDIKLTQVTSTDGAVGPTGLALNFSAYNTAAQGTSATYNAIVAAMGKIKYVNNGNNVQTFELRIPVEFTYTWGTIVTYVDVTVKGTMGN